MADETLANLELARLRLSAALADAALNPMPNYVLDGQDFEWSDYMTELTKQLTTIDDLIRRFKPLKIVLDR